MCNFSNLRKIKVVKLTPDELESLEKGYKQSDSVVFSRRCQIILLKSKGYSSEEILDNDSLIREEYLGIRPAPGYPACPEHSEKETIARILDLENTVGITLTSSYAMYPTSSVSGFYFGHPESKYFGLGKIAEDQVASYAMRKGISIEQAERFGLAQLHQLRGRVGRGSAVSHCVLLYHAPLSGTAQARLGVLRESNDGFVIAQRDLEIRGPGELLGTRQTGVASYRIADLTRDAALIAPAQQAAQRLWQLDKRASEALIRRWLGYRDIYAQA